MSDPSYTATRLKAELLGVLDTVERTGEPITVTKHGRPVARIVPIAHDAPLAGSVTFHVADNELAAPLQDDWDAETA